jgi:FkbM family methyltransferase
VLNYGSDYLKGELGWLNPLLGKRKSPVIIDIGANEGQYITLLLKINQSCNIFAFEPHPETYKKLLNRIAEEQVIIYNLGAGKENTELILYDYADKDNSQHASLYQQVFTDLLKKETVEYKIDVIKLDDFCLKENITHIDLLKIDTEGNEFNVLLGAKELLKTGKIAAIHFEFNSMNIISRTTFKDFYDLLEKYSLFRLLPGGKLLPIDRYHTGFCEIYAFQNIVAILKKEN